MKDKNIIGSIVLVALAISGAVWFINRADTTDAPQTIAEPKLEHVHGFAVDIENSDRLLLATHHGLFQLTENKLSRIGTVADDLMGFSPHPSDANIYFSSGHPVRGGNRGFQKSTDGGITWIKLSDGLGGPVDFHSMAVSTANPDIVYGHFRTIQRSKDGGLTWESIKGSIQPFMLTTHPQKEDIVFAATQTGVLISEDYGDTWNSLSAQIGSGAVNIFAISPNATDALAFSQTLEGLGKSTDGGVTWAKISESFGDSPVFFIAYDQKNAANVYAVNQANNIFKSTDGGDTWSKLH